MCSEPRSFVLLPSTLSLGGADAVVNKIEGERERERGRESEREGERERERE